MLLDIKRIEGFGGRAVFERAIFKAPFRYRGNLLEENRACFFYMVDGQYRSYSGSNKVTLQTRDGVVKQCGPYISEFLDVAGSDTCEAIAVYLYEDVLQEIYDETPTLFQDNNANNLMRKIASNDLVNEYIQSILFYFENPIIVDEQLVTLKLKELIILLLKTDKYPSVVALMTDLFRPQKTSLKHVVEHHLFEDVTVADLAHLNNMSLSTFKREFKKVYAESPAKYIKQQKLEKAAKLLSISDYPITSIAFECGFNNSAYFSTVFQRHYGKSPKEYRLDQSQNT